MSNSSRRPELIVLTGPDQRALDEIYDERKRFASQVGFLFWLAVGATGGVGLIVWVLVGHPFP